MPYLIEITDIADQDLAEIKKFYRQKIIDAIKEQLTHEPTRETKNKKSCWSFNLTSSTTRRYGGFASASFESL